MDSIWIVTNWNSDLDSEPIVAAFNNKEAASECYEYFKKEHYECCLDECLVYSTWLF